MRIIVAGGTGFIGKALVQALSGAGHEILLLQRPGSRSRSTETGGFEVVRGDPEKPLSLGQMEGDAVINLVGIIREFPSAGVTFHGAHCLVTKNLVDYARRAGIKRFLQMSALGVRPNAKTKYLLTKYEAEQYVKESGLEWTIFRPSVVFGPGSHLVRLLSNMIRRLPAVPVIGDGKYKLQPVHVTDICAGFHKSLDDSGAIGRTYDIGGPEIMTYDRILDIIGEALAKRKVVKLHQPVWLLRPMASVLGRFRWFPFTNEQVTMLLEDNYTEDKSYFEHFGIARTEFGVGLRQEIEQAT